MTELTLFVDGMGCRDCVREVTALLRDVPGVETVAANHRRSLVVLGGSMTLNGVRAALQETRFHIGWITTDRDKTESGQQSP